MDEREGGKEGERGDEIGRGGKELRRGEVGVLEERRDGGRRSRGRGEVEGEMEGEEGGRGGEAEVGERRRVEGGEEERRRRARGRERRKAEQANILAPYCTRSSSDGACSHRRNQKNAILPHRLL